VECLIGGVLFLMLQTLKQEWKNGNNGLHELSTRRCVGMTRGIRWVGIEVREPPTVYGQNNLEEILMNFEVEFLEN
jgi:hypothetical protein